MGAPDPLRVLEEQPLNAEPKSLAELTNHDITPSHLVYARNHSVIVDFRSNAEDLVVKVDGEIDGVEKLDLTLNRVRNDFPQRQVVAVLVCAGNRRAKMAQKTGKDVRGVKWSEGTAANLRWTGAPLREILRTAGVSADDSASWKGLHVRFASHVAPCDSAEWYGGSITLEKAMSEDGDVLLAYEMNGVPLSPGQGFPLRVVVPGCYGMRWVKWVDHITVSRSESPNFFQQTDYRILPEQVTSMEMARAQGWWSTVPSMQNLDCNSVVTSVERVRHGAVPSAGLDALTIKVRGYAYSDRTVKSVDVSVNGGSSWYPCEIKYQDGRWSWAIWEGSIDLMADEENVNDLLLAQDLAGGGGGKKKLTVEVLSRATDSADRVQKLACPWNLRGVGYNGAGEATLDVYL